MLNVWGWDAHGYPAERYTEKKLNIHSRQEVLDYGLEKYIVATRANMLGNPKRVGRCD